jgi:transposase InsO family protein
LSFRLAWVGYGWPRRELLARGIRTKGKRRFKVTSDSNHDMPISANLLNREFMVAEPDRAWAGDITLYLVAVTTCYRHTRRVSMDIA